MRLHRTRTVNLVWNTSALKTFVILATAGNNELGLTTTTTAPTLGNVLPKIDVSHFGKLALQLTIEKTVGATGWPGSTWAVAPGNLFEAWSGMTFAHLDLNVLNHNAGANTPGPGVGIAFNGIAGHQVGFMIPLWNKNNPTVGDKWALPTIILQPGNAAYTDDSIARCGAIGYLLNFEPGTASAQNSTFALTIEEWVG